MSERKKLNVGVVGCGNISGAYLQHSRVYQDMEITTVADLNEEAAKAMAEKHELKVQGIDELMKNPDIDIVLNLTTPQAHVPVNLQALENGKHAYCEKPFGLDRESSQKVLDLAKEKGLRVGCAPDTFLGSGHQTARKVIDDGWIGDVLSGTAFMMCPGHEAWHPAPEFYYQPGGGPLLDMGPYYITNLVQLLGPVAEVQSMTMRSPDRVCTSESRKGDILPVDVETHVTGNLRFESGAVITMVMSFDVRAGQHNPIELHGSKGSLHVPDPNGFSGEVNFAQRNVKGAPTNVPHLFAQPGFRSLGLADMAHGIIYNKPHRASGELAYHVLDVMLSLLEAGESGNTQKITSTCERPNPMNRFAIVGEIDS